MPGVQYPHWSASWAMKASCSGCSASPRASPSMVTTSCPATSRTATRHERTASPSTRTVQAPQVPSPQPYFVPVSPRSARRTQSSVRPPSTSSATGRPLRRKRMVSLMAVTSVGSSPAAIAPSARVGVNHGRPPPAQPAGAQSLDAMELPSLYTGETGGRRSKDWRAHVNRNRHRHRNRDRNRGSRLEARSLDADIGKRTSGIGPGTWVLGPGSQTPELSSPIPRLSRARARDRNPKPAEPGPTD